MLSNTSFIYSKKNVLMYLMHLCNKNPQNLTEKHSNFQQVVLEFPHQSIEIEYCFICWFLYLEENPIELFVVKYNKYHLLELVSEYLLLNITHYADRYCMANWSLFYWSFNIIIYWYLTYINVQVACHRTFMQIAWYITTTRHCQ